MSLSATAKVLASRTETRLRYHPSRALGIGEVAEHYAYAAR